MMMKTMADMNMPCGCPGDRDEILVSYLYDAIDPIERAVFDAHLATCARCRSEIADLRGVRARLGQWAPPEPARAFAQQPTPRARGLARVWMTLGEVPVWAQVAAALMFLGVAAGVANLDVRYGREGLTVRTGWWMPAAEAVVNPARSVSAVPASAPWRADLAALERQLRAEFHASEVIARPRETAAMPGVSADVIRRVRALIDESERRQLRELALRVAEVVRDVSAQRQGDLMKIDRTLGLMQNNTGIEVAKQRELINYLVRASQRQ
jgi:anti-sigma factor RsiW